MVLTSNKMRRIKTVLVFFIVCSLLTIVLLLVMFQLLKQMKQLKTTEGIKPSEPAISRS
jgi:uncharacterized membrane protein AbrB (regulator of aidB expression)